MSKIYSLTTGAIGIASVETVNQIPIPEIDPSHSTAGLVIQIILALATLWKMFKKPKGVS